MIKYLRRLYFGGKALASLDEQISRLWPVVLVTLLISVVVVFGVYGVSVALDVSPTILSRDPASVTGSPVYIGMLSTFGIMLWSGAATICLFGAAIARPGKPGRANRVFLLASGVLTLLLGLDDAFLLHEEILPARGIPEPAVYSSYVALTGAYLLFFCRILSTDYLILAAALFFLGLSFVTDIFPLFRLPPFVEDSLKFIGIAFWLVYFARMVVQAVDQVPPSVGGRPTVREDKDRLGEGTKRLERASSEEK